MGLGLSPARFRGGRFSSRAAGRSTETGPERCPHPSVLSRCVSRAVPALPHLPALDLAAHGQQEHAGRRHGGHAGCRGNGRGGAADKLPRRRASLRVPSRGSRSSNPPPNRPKFAPKSPPKLGHPILGTPDTGVPGRIGPAPLSPPGAAPLSSHRHVSRTLFIIIIII